MTAGRALLVAAALSFPVLALQAQEGAGKALLQVTVNTQVRGQLVVELTEDGDVLLPEQELRGLGLVQLPQGIAGGDGRVSLRSLAPGVQFRIDEQEAGLQITAAPELFAAQQLAFGRRSEHEVLRDARNALFLNYSLDHGRGDGFEYLSLAGHAELGLRWNGWLGLSDFGLQADVLQAPLVRRLSSLIYDDQPRLRRFTVGDLYATSGEGGSGLILGGLSFSRSFAMSPYLAVSPAAVVAGALGTPSHVEVYVNGILVAQEDLQPGPFEFLDLPIPSGAATTELVVKDAYGREQRITMPSYLSSLLLNPGFQDFGYSLGFRRLALGESSFDYGEPAVLGYHRLGLTRSLTGGFRFEADRRLANGAATAAFTLARAGELNLTLGVSGSSEGFGYSGSLRYLYSGHSLGGSLSLDAYSSGYATLARPEEDRLLQARLALGGHSRRLGSASASFGWTLAQDLTATPNLVCSYGRRLGRALQLRLGFNARGGPEPTMDGSLAIDLLPRKLETAASLEYQAGLQSQRVGGRLQKNTPRGPGVGYELEGAFLLPRDAGGASAADIAVDLTADLQLALPWALLEAGYVRSDALDLFRFNASGGAVLLDGSLHFSRPIEQSFALARLEGVRGVRVASNGEAIGRTDRRGELLVPGLAPYAENRLSIEALDLPISLEPAAIQLYYAPPYRGGGVVEFGARTVQGFYGRLFWLEDGKRIPAELAGLALEVRGRTVQSVVGRDGEFYLEDLPPGRYTGRLFLEERQGSFQMEVPRSAEPQVDLGDIDSR